MDGQVSAKEFTQYRRFAQADTDGDGVISSAELAAYTVKVQAHAHAQHASFSQVLETSQAEADELRAQLRQAQGGGAVNQVSSKSKSNVCAVQ